MKTLDSNNSRRLLAALILFVMLSAYFIPQRIMSRPGMSCTTLTVSSGNTVLFGNNEDNLYPDSVISFYPAKEQQHGMVKVGYYDTVNGNRGISYQGGMNDQGVAWDALGYPPTRLTPHPERPYSFWEDNFLGQILEKAATVEDVLQMIRLYDFGNQMSMLIHIADASGDAAAIYPGPDGEVVFDRKSDGDGHLLSVSKLPKLLLGKSNRRFETAAGLLDNIKNRDLTIESIETVLGSVRQDGLFNAFLRTHTVYSNIFDLPNQMIHLYYFGQNKERVTLDLEEELAKGEYTVYMADLFSFETTVPAYEAFTKLQQTVEIVKTAVNLVVLTVIILLAILVIRWFRRTRKPSQPSENSRKPVHPNRFIAIDALRGLIIVFMALDHANYFIAHQHSSGEYWGGAYPVYESFLPFLTRFVTHFCAPGFFFLMGVGMALFTISRQKRGWTRLQIVRHFLLRGLVLIGLQLLVVNRAWELTSGGWGIEWYFGVLYALGGAMILSSALLWLKPHTLIGLSLALLIGTELLVPDPLTWGQNYHILQNLFFFAGGNTPGYWVNYPILAWLELAVFGLAFGQLLAQDREKTFRLAAGLGALFLILFSVLRGLDGFGNLRPMVGSNWMDYINPVKYPASITFVFLTIGGNLLILWLLHGLEKRNPAWLQPLVVFGRTPLFFYVMHLFLYAVVGRILTPNGTSLTIMYPLWILGLLILYPMCSWYGSFKFRQPENSVLKFL